MTVHNFQESLEESAVQDNASWVLDAYRLAFPNLLTVAYVAKDGWAQRGGIDHVLTLSSGKVHLIDLKLRKEVWPDILLEYWSSVEHKTPGWVVKELACDSIGYGFTPIKTLYLLPFQTLRAAWRENHRDWVGGYGFKDTPNEGYTTRSCPVPIDVLMAALNDAMKITCAAVAEAAAQ